MTVNINDLVLGTKVEGLITRKDAVKLLSTIDKDRIGLAKLRTSVNGIVHLDESNTFGFEKEDKVIYVNKLGFFVDARERMFLNQDYLISMDETILEIAMINEFSHCSPKATLKLYFKKEEGII